MERTTIRPIVGRVPPLARPRARTSGEGSADAARHEPAGAGNTERDLLTTSDDRGQNPAGPAEIAGPAADPAPGRPFSAAEPRDERRTPFPIRLAPDVAVAAGHEPPAGDSVRPLAAARRYHAQADMLGRIRPGSIRPLGRMTDEEA